jgi:hypothetical protein
MYMSEEFKKTEPKFILKVMVLIKYSSINIKVHHTDCVTENDLIISSVTYRLHYKLIVIFFGVKI